MSIAKKLILVLFCIALTPTVFADNVKDVNVVNTPTVNANIVNPDPITVTGAVEVNGPLEATIAGPLDVSGSVVEVVNTPANPIPVSDAASVPPSQLVILGGASNTSWFPCNNGAPLYGVLADGTYVRPFTIPSGQVLVITSIQFQANYSFNPGKNINISLLREGTNSTSSYAITLVETRVLLDSSGNGSTNISMPTGFVVKSGDNICLRGTGDYYVRAQGYLAPDF